MSRSLQLLLCCGLCALAAGTRAEAQVIRGTVVEEGTRVPLEAVTISVTLNDRLLPKTTTSAGGHFQLEAAPGELVLLAERIGYGAATVKLRVRGDSAHVVVIELLRSPFGMDTVRARIAARPPWLEPAGITQRPMQIAAGERMAVLERSAASTVSVVTSFSGLRRRASRGRVPCFESARSIMPLDGDPRVCRMVVIILDGNRVGPDLLLQPVSSFESIEYLPPVDAGTRYGLDASANGAIVLWTRGFGPRKTMTRDPERK